jgi:hypothetical protein
MSDDATGLGLYEGMMHAGMSVDDVWLGQRELGGDADSLSIEAYLLGLLRPDRYQHNLIAQAINEHFIGEGGDHPVAYW